MESTTKKDLIAYLQRIALYCHQLNITSKVKADVQNVSGELIVSGLDSATSLIQVKRKNDFDNFQAFDWSLFWHYHWSKRLGKGAQIHIEFTDGHGLDC